MLLAILLPGRGNKLLVNSHHLLQHNEPDLWLLEKKLRHGQDMRSLTYILLVCYKRKTYEKKSSTWSISQLAHPGLLEVSEQAPN